MRAPQVSWRAMNPLSNPCIRLRRHVGFTLIEVVVVLLIFTVIVGMAALITRGVAAGQKRSLTATRLALVDAALVQYVLQQRRLPCAANGALPSSDNTAGLEVRVAGACTGNAANGVVPWRTLALTELEATDGWDRRLTYRVFPALAADGGMDMTWCDPAGSELPSSPTSAPPLTVARACNPACTAAALSSCTPSLAFLFKKGILVQNAPIPPAATQKLMDPDANPPTGAAYVLISHGETGGGGFLNTGVRSSSTVVDGTEEAKNYADPPAAYYVDSSISDVSGATHFDDVVSRPSVLAVISKAGLGPRAHN